MTTETQSISNANVGEQLSLSFGAESRAVTPPTRPTKPRRNAPRRPSALRRGATADTLAKQQREISVSEFFAKNRHLLGFDNKRKALLTTVKEAVDNCLDACEEGGFLPEISVRIRQTDVDRFAVTVRDNGPGIVKQQIPNVFGKLLYGSKFHRLKMSRGQQGIGISAAGMYGLITTGKPIRIASRTGGRAPAHCYTLAIDTKKNRPDIINDETVDVEWPHGTEVTIELAATYNKGRQSVDEYIELTAIANPHATIHFHPPDRGPVELSRGTDVLPAETKEIKPHPYGIELGTFLKMLKETSAKKVGAFLTTEFSRVSSPVARRVCERSGITTATWISSLTPPTAERVYNTLLDTRLKAPSTNCLAPMGAEAILTGLLKGVRAEFYTASTRPPSVYRGNPFQIEIGLAYGGQLGSDRRDGDGDGTARPASARVIRFANRVPLLYQQSSCALYKAILDTRWNNYGLSQPGGAIPQAPLLIMLHMASVWVPFISEGKEAIADYDEIRKEVRLGLAECGRRLGMLLRRKRKKAAHSKRRDVFTRYIDEVVESVRAITVVNKEEFRRSLVELSRMHTAQADVEFDEHGKQVKSVCGNDLGLQDTIVVDRNGDDAANGANPAGSQAALFNTPSRADGRRARPTAKTKRRKARTRR